MSETEKKETTKKETDKEELKPGQVKYAHCIAWIGQPDQIPSHTKRKEGN